jgi:hypothetical protein
MSPKWKPPKEERTDSEAVRREREFRQRLEEVLEYGDEDDFVRVLKAYKPDISGDDLKAAIKQFHVSVREKRGLY